MNINTNYVIMSERIPLSVTSGQHHYRLVREKDKLTKTSKAIKWLKFNPNGGFKKLYKEPSIGVSLLMSPFNPAFTWKTTSIIQIIEHTEDYIKFKTTNSVYELWRILT
jgi:hypothetical protein